MNIKEQPNIMLSLLILINLLKYLLINLFKKVTKNINKSIYKGIKLIGLYTISHLGSTSIINELLFIKDKLIIII